MRLVNAIKNALDGFCFVTRNLLASGNLHRIPRVHERGVVLAGLERVDLPELSDLHQQLRSGKMIGSWRRMLLWLEGGKFVMVAKDETGQLLGFQLFYFRETEWRKKIIHEAYIGLKPAAQGAGLGSAMRALALAHFQRNGIAAISTRITADNLGSLKSAEKAGWTLQNRPLEALDLLVGQGTQDPDEWICWLGPGR
jgi:RimJ/RimL family protein N-acetyltransferase